MAPIRTLALTAAALALAACGQKAETAKGAEAAAAPAATPAAGPATMPSRKPGLWTQTVATGGMSQTSRICLDATVDKAMSAVGEQTANCSRNDVSRTAGGGYAFTSVCEIGQGMGTTTTQGTLTGDFNSAYKVEAETTIAGASAPQMNGTRKVTMEARWEGPCPAGFKPGDMELPGGVRMNIAAGAAAMKGAN